MFFPELRQFVASFAQLCVKLRDLLLQCVPFLDQRFVVALPGMNLFSALGQLLLVLRQCCLALFQLAATLRQFILVLIAPSATFFKLLGLLGKLLFCMLKFEGEIVGPLGFGDKAKAQELLRKALAVNPRGIDPNFFYGEYLVETGRPREAVAFLERALEAPARPGREIADAGRRDEARALLDRARAEAK